MATVKISGEATEGAPDKYGVQFDTSAKTWRAEEPAGASKVFKTKSGDYKFSVMPENGTALFDAQKKLVAFLKALNPGTTTKPASGGGRQDETVRTINWKLE